MTHDRAVNADTSWKSLVDATMHSPVVTIDKTETVRTAAVVLHGADMGTLAVMAGSTIAGVLSERDIIAALATGADPDQTRVADVMSKEPRYLTSGEDVATAVETMLAAGIRHLPVLEDGELIGIVSMRDLMGALRR